MNNWTHPEPEPGGDYRAYCTAETACGWQAIGDDPDTVRDMITGHYVTDRHASDWNKPLRGRR